MSRPVSAAFQAAANAQETGEVVITLLTITHPDTEDVIRLSSDPTQRLTHLEGGQPVYGTVSRGNDYLFLPLTLTLPDEREDSPPAARVIVNSLEPEIVTLLRSTATPAQVVIEILLASDLETVEVAFPVLDLAEASPDYEAGSVTLDLVVDFLANEPYPAGSFDPSVCPGLFG